MAAQKQFYNFEEPQRYRLMAEDEPRAVFVDTSLNTHLAVAASPFLTVSHLQQQISLEHFNCFPKFGRIIVKALSVEFNGTEYHLPETMLLKTAFHGSMKTWIVSAEIWKPVGYLDFQKDEVKHVKSSQDHHISKHTKPSPKHDHDHRHVSPHYHRHVSPHYNMHVSSHYHETPKTSIKKKRKDEERKDVKKIDIDVHKQPSMISEPKENVKTKNDVSKTGSQDRKTVLQKDHPVYDAKEQLDDKTRNYSQRTGEDSGHKLPHRPCVVHHNTSVVKPSVLPMEDGGDNVVKEGTSADFAENSYKKRGTRAKKKKSKKSNINSINQHSTLTSVNGCAILGKGDAPSDNGNTIQKSGQNEIEPAGDVSLSQLNNVREPLSQQDLLNLEKEIEEDLPLMKPHRSSKKRKACESERESRKGAQKVSPSHLSNVTEPLAQVESLNPIEKEKEIKEDLKLENSAKKRKTSKAKSSDTNLEFSSRKPNDSEKTVVTRNIHGELLLPDDVGSLDENGETASITANNSQSRKAVLGKDPSVTSAKECPDDEIKNMASTVTAIQSDKPNKKSQKKQSDDVGSLDENVETVSITAKNSQSRKAVPRKEPSLCSVKERPDEEIEKMGSTITAIQSDKPNKKSQKKQSVLAENVLSVTGNQHSNETMMEMDAPKNVGDSLTRCDANDALVKSDDNDQEYRKSADVASSSLLNDGLKVMSQDEPLNMIENERETKEDVALLKSENTVKKRKTKKAKNSGMENQDSSSKRQNQEETDGTRLVHVEHSLQNDIGRPEGNVETINGNLKRSRNRKAVHEKDHCESPMLEQPDEETREEDVAISSIQGDKPKKRTRKKQSIPGMDLSSLPVDQQLDEKTMKVDAPKRVEQTESCHDDSKHQEKVVQAEGYHDIMSESLPLEGPSGLEDMRLLDKPRASKRKSKKLDPLTSVETSSNGHNLVESKKKMGCEEHQKRVSNHRDLDVVSHAGVEDGSNVSGANYTVEMDVPNRVDDSLTDNKSNDVQCQKAMRQGEEHGEFSPASGPGPEVSAEVRQLEKPRSSKQKTKKVDQPSSVDTLTNGHKLVDKESPETFELQGSVTDQKNNKSIPPPSAKHSTVSKNLMDTLASPADLIYTSRKTGVSYASLDDRSQSSGESSKSAGNTVRKLPRGKKGKEPSDKVECNGAGLRRTSRSATSKVLGASEQKKGVLSTSSAIFGDGNSSSSDGEDRTNASNSSTTLPPEDSEGESKGVLISEHDSLKNNGSSKANSSGLKLESILRSSSRYKKAKLVASQSQGESEPPEFVPDSQADK